MKVTNEWVTEYGEQISRIAHRMISDTELAREAAQEVWFEVMKSINSFKGESELSTWLYTVARRTILRYAVNERTITGKDIEQCIAKGQLDYDDAGTDREEWIKEKCDLCITSFCHCLNNEARLVFLFHENLDLSYKQISTIMEMSEDNVRQVLSRAMKKVRSFMNNECTLLNPKGNCGCRIRDEVRMLHYDEKYRDFIPLARQVDFFMKFDKELPRKNYWLKYLELAVGK